MFGKGEVKIIPQLTLIKCLWCTGICIISYIIFTMTEESDEVQSDFSKVT